MARLNIPAQISDMIEVGALVAINTSGGKDSQAMTITLIRAGIPRAQLVLVHASVARKKRPTVSINKRNSVVGRRWIDWLPIHDMDIAEVFQTIATAGQDPHWADAAGMSRLSCRFSLPDLLCTARLRPDLLAQYARLEQEVDHTLRPDGVSLSKTIARLEGHS